MAETCLNLVRTTGMLLKVETISSNDEKEPEGNDKTKEQVQAQILMNIPSSVNS